MAITTLSGAESGLQYPRIMAKVAASNGLAGVPRSHFYQVGYPAAAVAPTPGLAGAALTSYAGQIPFTNPASGNTYLGRLQAAVNSTGNGVGTVLLCDRLWHNSGINVSITTSQTINSVTWPARDANQAVSGEGVYIGVEVSTAMGTGATTQYTMNYTNQAGTAGRSGTAVVLPAASHPLGTFTPIGLAAGDTGVRSVQQFTINVSHTSGTIHLVAYRVIAVIELPDPGRSGAIDALSSGFPRFWNDSVPFMVDVLSVTNPVTTASQLLYSQG